MFGKKDLVIAVLATFCLTATLFMVFPTRSQYDPWVDTNEDGAVDSSDLGALGSAWGTFGDPAKNVIIANHTTARGTIERSVNSGIPLRIDIETNGYKEIACGFWAENQLSCTVQWIIGAEPTYSYTWEQFELVPIASPMLKVYEIHGWNITLWFGNYIGYPLLLRVDYYMST